mmetsp:Transcript_16832/g.58727  ORF Transcript_16832/g.58727 Transcript_16832/m.58727 type:complete len:226 (+) Transcript_16832:223-900(+)
MSVKSCSNAETSLAASMSPRRCSLCAMESSTPRKVSFWSGSSFAFKNSSCRPLNCCRSWSIKAFWSWASPLFCSTIAEIAAAAADIAVDAAAPCCSCILSTSWRIVASWSRRDFSETSRSSMKDAASCRCSTSSSPNCCSSADPRSCRACFGCPCSAKSACAAASTVLACSTTRSLAALRTFWSLRFSGTAVAAATRSSGMLASLRWRPVATACCLWCSTLPCAA